MNISILETRQCKTKVNNRGKTIPNYVPRILHLRHRSHKTLCFVTLTLGSLCSCSVTVCMSVCCAVGRGVYLIRGVTVDREFILLCGEKLYCLPKA